MAVAIGIKPRDATKAVISTGLRRVNAPSRMASSSPMPFSRKLRMKEIMTRPLSTATPDNAMKPTPAEIESGISRIHNAIIPPVSAKGTPVNTSRPSLTLPNIMNSSVNTSNSDTGTTICRRLAAD
ncbi:hypothetical protein D3C81_1865730 [compost metagenome]